MCFLKKKDKWKQITLKKIIKHLTGLCELQKKFLVQGNKVIGKALQTQYYTFYIAKGGTNFETSCNKKHQQTPDSLVICKKIH